MDFLELQEQQRSNPDAPTREQNASWVLLCLSPPRLTFIGFSLDKAAPNKVHAPCFLNILSTSISAGDVLEELRLARNCDFSKAVKASSSSGLSNGVRPVPTDDKEVIPESDDEGDDSGPTQMVAETQRKTAGNRMQGLDSIKVGTRRDYTEGASEKVPRNLQACESGMGARDGKARCCFDGLLAAVRSAESLHLLDLSENGLERDQITQLRVAFQRDNSELEDGWQVGLLRRL